MRGQETKWETKEDGRQNNVKASFSVGREGTDIYMRLLSVHA
jgi:hypothetical protein